MIRYLLLLASFFCLVRLTAQAWQPVGADGFSNGQASQMSIALSNTNTPYVAYSLVPNGRKASVKKFDGTSWQLVGPEGFSAGEANYLSLCFDGATPYIIYRDKSISNKAIVQKFDGAAWQTVGSAGFSAGAVSYCGIAVNKGVPYAVYIDDGNSGKPTVKKFNGTAWENVGTAFGGSYSSYTSIAFYADAPYVAFQDIGAGGKAAVKKFNGSSWIDAGPAGISAGTANDVRLAFNGAVPYVIYSDNGKSNKAVVKKFNGTVWEAVGDEGFSAGGAAYTSIAFSANKPYAAYTDATKLYKCTVKKFNGTAWEAVGNEAVSADIANFTNIVAGGGSLYLFYSSNASGAYVKKWAETLPINLLSFNAALQKSNVLLQWQVAHNINFSHVEVERNNGAGFTNIASVPFTQAGLYQHTDESPLLNNIAYYRLKLVDKDGAFTYSKTVTVKALGDVAVYPNPFTGSFYVNAKATHIQLTDAHGKTVLQQKIAPGQQRAVVQHVAQLPAGIYMLVVTGPGGKQVIKLIKQ